MILEKDANTIFRTNGVIFRYDKMNDHIFTNKDPSNNNALLTPNANTPILKSTKDDDTWKKVKGWDDEKLIEIGRSTPDDISNKSKEFFQDSSSLGDTVCTHWGVYDLKELCAVEASALEEGNLLHRFAPPKPAPKQQQQQPNAMNNTNNNNNNNAAAANNNNNNQQKQAGKKAAPKTTGSKQKKQTEADLLAPSDEDSENDTEQASTKRVMNRGGQQQTKKGSAAAGKKAAPKNAGKKK